MQQNTDERQVTKMWIEGQVKRDTMPMQLHADTGTHTQLSGSALTN